MPHLLHLLAAFAGAAVVTFALTPLVAWYARRVGYVDRPGGRKLHDRPVPRIGGVAVFFGLVAGAAAYAAAFGPARLGGLLFEEGRLGLLVPCAIVFTLGLVDDVRGTTPLVKVTVQSLAALVAMQAGYLIDELWTPFGTTVPLGLSGYPLTLLWFIAVTNAFNLIDGLDGLLASVGIASLIGCAAVAFQVSMVGTAFMPLALAGALAGFLYWNRHRARVFMGDGGSLLVGFAVAALALRVARYHGPPKGSGGIALHVIGALVALPALETVLSMARRYVNGRPLFAGDGGHMHHVLTVRKGLTVRRAVAFLALIQVLFSGIAVASRMRLGWSSIYPALTFFVLAVILIKWLGYVEFAVVGRRLVHLVRHRARQGLADAVRLAQAGEIIRRAESPRALQEALREAVDVGGFRFIAFELADEGAKLLATAPPALETAREDARRYAAGLGGRPAWILAPCSGARAPATAATAAASPAAGDPPRDPPGDPNDAALPSAPPRAGSVRYTVPVPAEDGRYGTLVCERSIGESGRAPAAEDVLAYLGGATEEAMARMGG